VRDELRENEKKNYINGRVKTHGYSIYATPREI